ncbi:MAG: hypothetical protein ACKVT0_07615 [Planctomycetaceae bacterium]
MFKTSICIGFANLLLGLIHVVLPSSACAQLQLKPGEEYTYHIEKTHAGAVKVLGTTGNSVEKWVTDVTAKVGEANADGRIPLALTVKSLTGASPVLDGLTMRNVDFDYSKWDKKKRLPYHSLLQYEAMMKRPLTLLYQPNGTLDGVAGTTELAADIDRALVGGFTEETDYPSSRPLYKSIYSEKLQKLIWDKLLVFDLPADFEVGLEWKQQRLIYVQPFYAWANGKFIAEDADDGGYSIEATFDFPANKESSVTFGPQRYAYSVKNGTGTGKYVIDSDGRVRSLETVMHVYFKNSLIAGDQTIPFDEYYSKIEYKIERK